MIRRFAVRREGTSRQRRVPFEPGAGGSFAIVETFNTLALYGVSGGDHDSISGGPAGLYFTTDGGDGFLIDAEGTLIKNMSGLGLPLTDATAYDPVRGSYLCSLNNGRIIEFDPITEVSGAGVIAVNTTGGALILDGERMLCLVESPVQELRTWTVGPTLADPYPIQAANVFLPLPATIPPVIYGRGRVWGNGYLFAMSNGVVGMRWVARDLTRYIDLPVTGQTQIGEAFERWAGKLWFHEDGLLHTVVYVP